MSDTILAYLISLGIIGAGVVWIVAGTISTTSAHRCRRDDHCRRVDQLHDRVSQPDALTAATCSRLLSCASPPDRPSSGTAHWLHEVKYDDYRLRKPGH